MPWVDEARALIASAVRAPSSHNTQPWLFHVGEEGRIDLWADRSRALPVNDPDGRELVISCGAALMNLRVAAASHGWAAGVDRLPDGVDRDWMARVQLERAADGVGPEGELAGSIEGRRTCRKPFAAREVASDAVDALVAAATGEGAWLRTLASGDARDRAAALVVEGDAAQWSDPAWRRELAGWLGRGRQGEGIPVAGPVAPLARFTVGHFDMGRSVGRKDGELARQAPLLALLGTEGDGPGDWLRAGEALERVLLTACHHGLQASYLNQPIQVASLRPRLAELVATGHPQLLLRFGYPAGKVPPAPRRPIDAVIRGQ